MDIRKELNRLPGMIAGVEHEMLLSTIEQEEIRQNLREWEFEQIDEISNVTDDYGKPMYSNDAKRQAELARRKRCSEEYPQMDRALKKSIKTIGAKGIELRKLVNIQENLRAICKLSVAEAELSDDDRAC
jgi:hypothetical protein